MVYSKHYYFFNIILKTEKEQYSALFILSIIKLLYLLLKLIISSITFEELEQIKNAFNKDADVKIAARKVL